MACSTCGKKNNLLSFLVNRSSNPISLQDCSTTEQQVFDLERRIRCVMRTTHNPVLNSTLGKLLSMINLKNYCKYSLTDINDIIDEYNTIC